MAKKIDVNGLDHYHDKVSAMLASEYSSSKTYAVGDYCFHAGTLYECTTAITTAENWTSGHWTAAKLAEDTSALKTALSEFSGVFRLLSAGVKKTGDIIFTSDDVSAGDVIYYNMTASGASGVAYIGFYDSSNVRLAYYGKGSSSSTILNYSGTAEIPSGFSYCQVFTNNNLTLDIGYIFNGKPYFEEINDLDNIVDSPFKSPVPNVMKGIIGFKFISAPFTNAQYKVTNIYYKDSFYFYMPVQVLRNGSWVSYDAIEIPLANAPSENAVTILTSKYGYFKVAFIPSMMTTGRATGINYIIKNSEVHPFEIDLQIQIDASKVAETYGDFELKDTIKHVVTVDASGNGDYTTISAAYAAITDSNFDNQYEIVVKAGTYSEENLIPPKFTHTHGLYPNTVIVTSEGKTGTNPVFDQYGYPSKLSNMTIISGTGYCVHQDSSLNGVVLFNENLYCKKVYGQDVSDFGWQSLTNPSVIGSGAQYAGAKFVWKNCVFENGEISCHSPSSSDPNGNQHLVFEDCKLVNAWFWLGMAGSDGANTDCFCVAEFDNTYAPVGCPTLKAKFGTRINNATNFAWQILGGGNKNFSVIYDNSLDTNSDSAWGNINTAEKAYAVAKGTIVKGQWVSDSYIVASQNSNENNIVGVALSDASSGDTFQIWVGNAFSYVASDGEYGIGANGLLSDSATTKIGKVKNNIFYRYF